MGLLKPYSQEKEAILSRFQSVRSMTELIIKPLVYEDFVLSSTDYTNPPKWHLAHTTWFFENFVLKKMIKNYGPFRNDFNFLFSSYYKYVESSQRSLIKKNLSRPTTQEIMTYRKVITEKILDRMIDVSESEFSKLYVPLEQAIQHEQQHQELLLMDIKRNFYINPLRPKYNSHHSHGGYSGANVSWNNIPSGLVDVGVPKNYPEFSFDNEKDLHKRWIESCMLSSHLVTNEEYLHFIEEGGYENPVLWHDDGWALKEKEGWVAPLYWEKDGQEWWSFTLSGMMPLDPSAPVIHVNFYEAVAFAKWKGARLPSEFEWETAAKLEKTECTFLETSEYTPESPGPDYKLYSQIHGAVWEWTQSSYLPYPRFEKTQPALIDQSDRYMVNQFVLRGGSCVTPRSHYRVTYRNFHLPQSRWAFSGIRLAKDLD